MSVETERLLDTVMPFGEHKGKPLREIPVKYLRWLGTSRSGPSLHGALGEAMEFFSDDIADCRDEKAVLGDIV